MNFLQSLCKHSLERRWPHAQVYRLASEDAWRVSITIDERDVVRANRDDAMQELAERVGERRVRRKRHASLGWGKRRPRL